MKSSFYACPSLKGRNLDNQLLNKIHPIFLFWKKKSPIMTQKAQFEFSVVQLREGKLWNLAAWSWHQPALCLLEPHASHKASSELVRWHLHLCVEACSPAHTSLGTTSWLSCRHNLVFRVKGRPRRSCFGPDNRIEAICEGIQAST